MVKIDTAPQEETTLPPVHLWLAHNLIREFVTLNPDDKHLQGWLTDFEKRWETTTQLDDDTPPVTRSDAAPPSYDGIGQYRSRSPAN